MPKHGVHLTGGTPDRGTPDRSIKSWVECTA